MTKTRKRSDPDRPSWIFQLEALQAEVESMPSGLARDAADHRAKQLEAAIHMESWLKVTDSPLPT